MSGKTKIFIDWANICHMSFSIATKNYETNCANGVFNYSREQIFFYNLASKIRKLSDDILNGGYTDSELIFVKDEDSIRKIMSFPNYKAHRSESEMPMDEAIAFIERKNWGRFCYSPDNEADDAIATLVTLEGGGVIVSADRDLWQLRAEHTRIFNPVTKMFVTVDDIEKAFSVRIPSQVALYKTLWGDPGDGVPNAVPRMQKYLLPIIRMTDGTLDSFKEELKSAWWSLSARCRELCAENQKQIDINWGLVKLDVGCNIVWE